ncbi:MAG TPA: hypothetical protein VEB86_02970 [Chryseosolibacter sp.]|nr:hypothetical protein [Chryseosolibacter sp.]
MLTITEGVAGISNFWSTGTLSGLIDEVARPRDCPKKWATIVNQSSRLVDPGFVAP